MTTHTLDRHNAARQRARVDRDLPKGTATLRTRSGEPLIVSGTLYTRRDGAPLIVFKHAGKWRTAETDTGYTVSHHHGHTTRSEAMIYSHGSSNR